MAGPTPAVLVQVARARLRCPQRAAGAAASAHAEAATPRGRSALKGAVTKILGPPAVHLVHTV